LKVWSAYVPLKIRSILPLEAFKAPSPIESSSSCPLFRGVGVEAGTAGILGASACFESASDVVNYNLQLVETLLDG
jgi:hypothetical protein